MVCQGVAVEVCEVLVLVCLGVAVDVYETRSDVSRSSCGSL
jgi:hypothetical protein